MFFFIPLCVSQTTQHAYFCHTRQATLTNCLVYRFVCRDRFSQQPLCGQNSNEGFARILIMDKKYPIKRRWIREDRPEDGILKGHGRRKIYIASVFSDYCYKITRTPIFDEKSMSMWAKPNSNIICFTNVNVGVALTFYCESF